MSSIENNPGDLHPEEDERYLYGDELVNEILSMIDQGRPVRLFIDPDVDPEIFRKFVETMRNAGAEVIFSANNL